MKTKKEIRQYAKGLAWGHFYYDDIPWEPFEYYDPESMATMIEDLALYAEHTYSTQPANDTKAQVASINEGDHT
jgi:hypothetical protein